MIAVRRTLIFRHRMFPCSYGSVGLVRIRTSKNLDMPDRKVEVGVCKELLSGLSFSHHLCSDWKLTLGLGVYKTGIRPTITPWKTSLS